MKALLVSAEQPLSMMSFFQNASQPSPAPPKTTKQASQFWTDHLSRVRQVSAFPLKKRTRRVLKDSARSINIKVSVPTDQEWATAGLQASWALCLSRLTGNKQVLFGVAVERTSEKYGLRQAATAIVPYAAEVSTTQSLAEDVRSWSQASRHYVLEGRDLLQKSRGELESAGQVDNILFIHMGETDELLSHEQKLLPVAGHPDDWGCGLTVSCTIASHEVISIQASFDSLLMDPARADLILRQYEHCIVQMFQHSNEETSLAVLDPISNHERSLMRQWSSRTIAAADKCVHDEVSQRATELPNNAAVDAWDGAVSYGELDDLSTRLAVRLVEAGVRTGTLVPLYFEKSTAVVVAMLGVIKSGGAFVPLDIKHPEKRRAGIHAELESSITLCSSTLRCKLRDLGASIKTAVIEIDMAYLRGLPVRNSKDLVTTVGLDDICYIIYTSGSTGKPKGTIVDHSNAATIVRSYRLRLGMTSRTRTLQYVALTFDVSIGDIFMTLASGGCLFMPTEEEYADAAGIVKAVNRTSANWLCLTPSLATLFQPEDVPTLQSLVLIGEAMRTDIVEAWADRVALVNAYGPSEATIESSCRLVRRNTLDHNNIGTPNDCLYWVVDENNHNKLVPIGCPGELLIQGNNVSRGYLHNSEKTQAAFVEHPEWMKDYVGEATKHRLYKTGDIVQQHSDGSATYLGRSGPEIKLRGQRMDVGEVEHHLRENLGQEWQAAVDIVHWEEDNRDPSLICFLARRAGHARAADAGALLEPNPSLATKIKIALASLVPVYMVPDFYLLLQNLPSTSSDKTDRNALRSIATHLPPKELRRYTANTKPASSHVSKGERRSPSPNGPSPSSQAPRPSDKFLALQKAWSDVLGVTSHSIDKLDDWFSIGGNSIKAMRLVAAARKEGLKLTVANIFNNPVLSDLELVASFRTNEKASRPQQTRNEHLFPLICARAPFLAPESIESAAVATDAQAWMLATGEVVGNGFMTDVYIDCEDDLDVARLTKACAEVTQHHPLLRTIFLGLDSDLLQVVLNDEHIMSKQDANLPHGASLQRETARKYFPHFSFEKLSFDGRLCHRLRLNIHHALYDAMSLELILNDISSAYCGRTLTIGLPFHSWIAQTSTRDFTATKAFWKEMLHTSFPTTLQLLSGPCRHDTHSGLLRVSVPIQRLQISAGSEASVLKAAWGTVLARELGSVQDVVFGQLTANRSSEFIEGDQVLGPCLNILPVRAYPSSDKEFRSLVRELDTQHRASLPHHDLGFRQIIRECTEWPSYARFSSIIAYQNHESSVNESSGSKFRIDDKDCVFSGHGTPADAADIWVVAQPNGSAVDIHIRYIPSIVSTGQAERLARNLTTVLETGRFDPLSPEIVSPTDSAWSLVTSASNGNDRTSASSGNSPTQQAGSLVSQAWREVNLFRDGMLPEANISMFNCGADVVSALLLSRFFQRHGCDFGVADIVRNPTQIKQASFLDSLEITNEPFTPAYAVHHVGPSDWAAKKRNTRYDLSDVDLTQHDGHIANYVIFPLEENKIASISAALETGLSKTLAQVPLLAGRVLRDSAKRSYVLCRPQDTCELALRHLDDTFPSYEKLKSMHFAPSMLPRTLLLPLSMPSVSSIYGHEWGEEGVPCLFLQASFVKGGMILATAWHHQVADAHACDIFLGLLSENTRDALSRHTSHLEPAYELDVDRSPFAMVDKGESIDDSGFLRQLGSLACQDPSALADIVASGRRLGEVASMLVHISETAALKQRCTPSAPKNELDFVSTYHCVSTLLHRTLVRARLHTGYMQPNEATAGLHAVNMRGRSPEAWAAYFGNAAAISSPITPMIASELVGEFGLQHGALNTRDAIRNVSLHHLRRYAQMHAAQGVETITQAMTALITTGTLVTSWQQMRLAAYDLGFGPPAAFRSPSLGVDGQVIIYPTLPGQGVVALITSRKKCIEAMEKDEELLQYGEVWDVERGSR
jgi:amino acid adenylation domain-containing protein